MFTTFTTWHGKPCYWADAPTKFVAIEATRRARAHQGELLQGLCSLLVVAGARPAHDGAGPGFRMDGALGLARARTGLLKVGPDILGTVVVFLSCATRLRLSWPAHDQARAILDLQYSPDGRFILTCSQDRAVKVWSATTGELVRTLQGHLDIVSRCCFAPDGRTILSSSFDSTLKFWDAESGDLQVSIGGEWHEGSVNCCAFSPNGSTVLSGSQDRKLRLYGDVRQEGFLARNCKLLLTVEAPDVALSCCFSPDGRHFLAGMLRGGLVLFRTTSGAQERCFVGHTGDVNACNFSPDGRFIVSGSEQCAAQFDGPFCKLWSAATGNLLRNLTGHSLSVNGCTFSPNGQTILTVSKDGTLRFWEPMTGRIRWIVDHQPTSPFESASPRTCRFSPDGKSFAVGFGGGCVKMWNKSNPDVGIFMTLEM